MELLINPRVYADRHYPLHPPRTGTESQAIQCMYCAFLFDRARSRIIFFLRQERTGARKAHQQKNP
jgi:hypothetical protein